MAGRARQDGRRIPGSRRNSRKGFSVSAAVPEAPTSAHQLSRPDPRRWRALAGLGLIQFLLILDGTVGNLALPRIPHDPGFSRPGLAWVVAGPVPVAARLLLL